MNKSRVKTITDGIIAIAAKIMVLELGIPSTNDWQGLLEIRYKFLAYVISFTSIDSNIRKSIAVFLICLLVAGFSACNIQIESTTSSKSTIDINSPEILVDLVSESKSDESVIYITELGEYTPYTVLCSNYSGGVLVCRSDLIDEYVSYQSESIFGAGGSYYAESQIDEYLNNSFIKRYSPELRNLMINADIVIADKATITRGDYRRNTETVQRNVFLLSAEELGITNSYLAHEGKLIPWFKSQQHLYSPSPQWLRSAYLWDDTHAWVLDGDHNYSENITKKLSCKPAIVLPNNLEIEKTHYKQKDIYILKNDEGF